MLPANLITSIQNLVQSVESSKAKKTDLQPKSGLSKTTSNSEASVNPKVNAEVEADVLSSTQKERVEKVVNRLVEARQNDKISDQELMQGVSEIKNKAIPIFIYEKVSSTLESFWGEISEKGFHGMVKDVVSNLVNDAQISESAAALGFIGQAVDEMDEVIQISLQEGKVGPHANSKENLAGRIADPRLWSQEQIAVIQDKVHDCFQKPDSAQGSLISKRLQGRLSPHKTLGKDLDSAFEGMQARAEGPGRNRPDELKSQIEETKELAERVGDTQSQERLEKAEAKLETIEEQFQKSILEHAEQYLEENPPKDLTPAERKLFTQKALESALEKSDQRCADAVEKGTPLSEEEEALLIVQLLEEEMQLNSTANSTQRDRLIEKTRQAVVERNQSLSSVWDQLFEIYSQIFESFHSLLLTVLIEMEQSHAEYRAEQAVQEQVRNQEIQQSEVQRQEVQRVHLQHRDQIRFKESLQRDHEELVTYQETVEEFEDYLANVQFEENLENKERKREILVNRLRRKDLA